MSTLALKLVDISILPLVVLVIGWLTKKYALPYLNTETKYSVAKYVLLLADEVTDWLVIKYPEKKWPEWLDEAVDKVMEIAGVSRDVAERAVRASLTRKKVAK